MYIHETIQATYGHYGTSSSYWHQPTVIEPLQAHRGVPNWQMRVNNKTTIVINMYRWQHNFLRLEADQIWFVYVGV